MQITLVAVGKIKEKYLVAGIAEYQKRLTPYCKLKITEIAEERLPDNFSAAQKKLALFKEGERILKSVDWETNRVLALDLAGAMLSSEDLAQKFDSLAVSGQGRITFIIGGAFGLAETVLAAADETISFSKLTFTHQMIRLILVEQIYRAFKISRKEKYHW
ncbi:MAG: 23S rRNA (pseudouridine(1915)-N(3))-methyltransferase RlmH [Sporomusaceae bacterium]|jgi:23S rRNA (pseudouridine1915-N3)-methyltransferase|nr:23S rRNA (pseudouridine(1915)-N(3))-methyltransferase RlmH [Sporomusaceae bacterium]